MQSNDISVFHINRPNQFIRTFALSNVQYNGGNRKRPIVIVRYLAMLDPPRLDLNVIDQVQKVGVI